MEGIFPRELASSHGPFPECLLSFSFAVITIPGTRSDFSRNLCFPGVFGFVS